MAARTLAAARSALLPADGLVARLLEADGDGLGAADLVSEGRRESRDAETDGFGVLRGGAEGVSQDADPAAAQAGVRESPTAVTRAGGAEPGQTT